MRDANRRWLVLVLALAGGACAGATAPASGRSNWTAVDLGTLGGHRDAFVQPIAMNDKGAVAAQVTWEDRRPTRSRRRSSGGTASGHAPHLTARARGSTSRRSTIGVTSSATRTAGSKDCDCRRSSGGTGRRPRWERSEGRTSEALGINDRRTGDRHRAGRRRLPRHAFIWQNGAMTDLGTLGGDDVFPTALNNEGQVIGESTTARPVQNMPFSGRTAR